MNDFGLLITSALTTGHPSVPYLFNEIPVEYDVRIEESNLIQSSGLVTPARITPPEFIQSHGVQLTPKIISPKNESVLRKIRNKIDSLDCCRLVQSSISATEDVIILKSSRDNKVSEANNKIILPSTSSPSFTETVEDSPRIKKVFAGAPNLQKGANSRRAFIGYTQSPPVLSFGNSGLSVRILQRLLLANGYPIRVDGNFGALTETAVKAFQTNRNLAVDGVVGQQTWQQLTR